VWQDVRSQLICLFRHQNVVSGFLKPESSGNPVYLGLAMDREQNVRPPPRPRTHPVDPPPEATG
jgi:hypothetical protein